MYCLNSTTSSVLSKMTRIYGSLCTHYAIWNHPKHFCGLHQSSVLVDISQSHRHGSRPLNRCPHLRFVWQFKYAKCRAHWQLLQPVDTVNQGDVKNGEVIFLLSCRMTNSGRNKVDDISAVIQVVVSLHTEITFKSPNWYPSNHYRILCQIKTTFLFAIDWLRLNKVHPLCNMKSCTQLQAEWMNWNRMGNQSHV